MLLTDREWKEFYIKDIFITEYRKTYPFFQIPTGAYIHKNNLSIGETPRVTVTSQNNGIDSYYNSTDKNYRTFKNFISISFLGTIFYHPYKASLDMKVHCLQLKNKNLNKYLSIFLISEIKKNIENASYANQLSSTDFPNKKIILPVADNNQPDYAYMEQYIKNLMLKKYNAYIEYQRTV